MADNPAYPAWSGEPFAGPLVAPELVPSWLRTLTGASGELDGGLLQRLAKQGGGTREAAVLVVFGADGAEDVVLQLRADTLGAHAGQVSFPGGGAEPGDHGPVETALREAREEVGLPADAVRPIGVLPRLMIPVSGYTVTPVLAHWTRDVPVSAIDPEETAAVARVPMRHLLDPANRVQVRVRERYTGPAFLVPGMLVWGFTGLVLTGLLSLGGWDTGSDRGHDRVLELDEAWRTVREMPPLRGRVQA
ncbi:NUDIX hydrolase [Sciscionella sediminilitoris]|uniref:NUDIX hydrolase n=1 Tax=Sciscionella sediminilitoris TaxID=1445613 RepID=UPI00068AE483|nr:CoA pyrophosphatase [Sciscionella sp. SE31]